MSSPLDGNGVAAPELKDGQIYRWHWKEGEQIGALEPYWCKSRIAIVKDGKLLDTYWSGDRHSVDVSRVDLAFMGDQNWPQLRPGEELRYDRADICDMRHANSSHAPIYVRPGAKLNKAAMLVVLDQREADARSDIRCRFCDHRPVCHLKQAPDVNCRTCQYSEPVAGGQWHCALKNIVLDKETQLKGCGQYDKARIYGEAPF